MTPSRLCRHLPLVCTLALMTGCGPALSTGTSGTSHLATRATRQALLYASTGAEVNVFDYPSGAQVGQLTAFDSGFAPEGLCADSAGDVFVAGTLYHSGQVYEFQYGGQTPIAKLATHGFADSCSVDSTTDNLAVAEYYYPAFGNGDVAIFIGAQGNPTYYADSTGQRFDDCAYDDSGNLFLAVFHAGELLELPNGSQSFQAVTLNRSGVFSGSLQWYNGELIVASWHTQNSPDTIERVKIYNGAATIVGTTVLQNKHNRRSAGQYFVDGGRIVGPDDNDKYLMMWKYPAGGHPIKNLGRGKTHWNGAVIVR